MDTNTAYEKNGFDLLRYAAACSVMLLHYSGFCMILSKNLPEKTAAVMSGIRKAALLFPWLVTQIVGIANTPPALRACRPEVSTARFGQFLRKCSCILCWECFTLF